MDFQYLVLFLFTVNQSILNAVAYRVNTILVSNKQLKGGSSNLITCNTSKDPGNCKGQEEAWYYDARDNQCYFFLYSGCGGNENRFPDLTSCKRSCVREGACKQLSCPRGCGQTSLPGQCPRCACGKGAAQKICTKSQRRGFCRALQHKWSYSRTDRRCVQFVYGGCGGNQNNFDTREECENVCGNL